MPNELSKKTYPDGTEVFYRDDTAREQISGITSRLGNVLDVKNSETGTFASLVGANQTWLVVGNRLTTSEGIMLLVNRYTDNVLHVVEIFKSTNMSYQTNTLGTVQLTYVGAGTGVNSCAIRLY